MRGFRRALASWQNSLLIGIEPTFFVHTWEAIGRSGADPFRKALPFEGEDFQAVYRNACAALGFDEVREAYPSLFEALGASATVNEVELRSAYGTDCVVVENDQAGDPAIYSNPEKMHYKIHAADLLRRDYGDSFDLVVRIRPDLPIRYLGFGWRDLKREVSRGPVLFADGPMAADFFALVMGDQMAIAGPEVMHVYADAWVSHQRLSACRLLQCSEKISGHSTLATTCWSNGVRVERLPFKRDALAEAENLSLSEISAAVALDAEARSFSWDREMVAALARDQANTLR
jgi:hypothetical protein